MTASPLEPLKFAPLPEPLRARIEAELAPGERLLWASTPDPKRPGGPKRSRASNLVWLAGWMTIGGLALGGMLTLPERFETGFWFLILIFFVSGVTSVLIATHLLAALAQMGSWQRQARIDLYALTDRRALIWAPAERSNAVTVNQYLPGSIQSNLIERLEYPDGSGNLTLKPGAYNSGKDGFFGVAHVRQVEVLVRQILVLPIGSQPTPPVSSQTFSSIDPEDSEEPF